MSFDTVTTIIPAYRAAHTIGRAIDSVIQQSHPSFEVLVIDDGSPDDIAGAVRNYGKQVKLIRKSNGGAASARNLGLDHATGSFVAFLDADDYWEPHKLERQLSFFARHPELGIAGGLYYSQLPGKLRNAPADPPEGLYDRVLSYRDGRAFWVGTRLQTSVILMRREVVGAQRFTSGLEPAEDRDLWVRLAANSATYLSSEPLMTYVEEPGSLSRTQVDRDYGNMLRVIHGHRELLGKEGFRAWEIETFRKWAARYLGNGEPHAAFNPAWKRVTREPLSVEGWWVLLKSCMLSLPKRR